MEEALDNGYERRKKILRKLGDGETENNPKLEDDQSMEADPRSKEEAMDQKKGPP